jgi:exopolysaccharide production protein ExoY
MVSDADAELARLCAGSDTIAQEWQVNQKLENDPRVTKIGKFLRKTHLDELPQLWNVLIGDMSVVGPRPFTPDQIQLYSSVGAKSYFSMRPGLTGPWQVSDRDAENNTFLARATYDEHYNHSASFSGDVKIVFQTILCVLKMRGQ